MDRGQHIVKRMSLCHLFILSRSMCLHADFNAYQHLVAAQRLQARKIFVYSKDKCFRISRIIIIPMLCNRYPNTLLSGCADGISKFHFAVAGIITVHMCIKYHLVYLPSVNYIVSNCNKKATGEGRIFCLVNEKITKKLARSNPREDFSYSPRLLPVKINVSYTSPSSIIPSLRFQ